MPLISVATIQTMNDDVDWTDAQVARAENLLAGVHGWIARNAPCLAVDQPNEDAAAEARMIIAEAILRAVDSTGNIGSEGIGASQVNYIDRAALPTLTQGDEAKLRALCPKSARRRYGSIRTRPGY